MSSVRGWALRNIPVIMLALVFIGFSVADPRFFSFATVTTVLRSAAYIGIVAVAMTLVLMIAGIDLSVGSMMYLTAVVVGNVIRDYATPVIAVPLLCILVGLVLGAINATAVAVLRIVPFIVTLAMLTAYRGLGLHLSNAREMNYPDVVTDAGSVGVAGITLPVVIFALVVVVMHVVVTRTQFGRQVLAAGEDPRAAERAGINVRRLLFQVFTIAGGLVGLAAYVAMLQLQTAAPGFGRGDEFDAIAAAVLGGTSLFGGRGSVFPGTVVGTLLIQFIETGLSFLQVDLYVQPMFQAGIILLAVLIDSVRTGRLERMKRRIVTATRADLAEIERLPGA